ncbi:MAG TPA: hypothetical protein VGY76_09260 [Solirubrobacteraceae bacterium]|jgi:cell division septum initiation protein DivIVA|nr:hypothetical protein [Solirubrobacteraceae bacterium]
MSNRRDLVSTTIMPRIKAVLTAAEQNAAIVAEEAETEAGRRSAEILAAAELDANRIRHEATRRVEDYLAATRRRIDGFAAARIERITELTESVLEAAESIQERLEQATHVQQQVHAMIEALGNVAEAVAQEVAQPSPTLPQPPSGPVRPAAVESSNGSSAVEDVKPEVDEGKADEDEDDHEVPAA